MLNFKGIAESAVWDHGAQQKVEELEALLKFIHSNKVTSILEIGSDAGGTLYCWAKMGIKAYAVDQWCAGFSSGNARREHGATLVEGNSHDPEAYKTIKKAIGSNNHVDMLFIDGDHTYTGVSNDFWIYKALVRPRGYIAIHDICEMTKGSNDIQVFRFWDYLKEEYPGWEKWEFKQFPENWGGIGIVRNILEARTTSKIEICGKKTMLVHPMSSIEGEYDLQLVCDYPKNHNMGVASQHHCDGVFWW